MNEKIVIYGCGTEGEKFYNKFNKEYNILFAIDKKKQIQFHDLDIYTLQESIPKLQQHYIVVSMIRRNYNEVKKELENIGLKEFRDFCSCEILNQFHQNYGVSCIDRIKEYDGKLYVYKVEEWCALCETNLHNDRKLKVEEVYDGIALPVRTVSHTGDLRGGIYTKEYEFVAGFLRHGEERFAPENPGYYGINEGYEIKEDDIEYFCEDVIFGGVLINHFGHFMLECLSRLWYCVIHPEMTEKILFLYNQYAEWMDEFIQLLDIPKERIWYIGNRPCKFRKIIVPEESAHSQKEYYDEYMIPYRKILQNITSAAIDKVYLTKRVFNQNRDAGNDCYGEEYFEEFFQSRGYQIVAPETFSVKESLEIISGAKEIVTTAGSISHFALFCQPGTEFTILNRDDGHTHFAQVLVNQVSKVNWRFVDVSLNFLFAFRQTGINQLGATRYFKAYVKDKFNESIEDNTLEKTCYGYIREWCKWYSQPEHFRRWRNTADFEDIFHVINRMHRVLYGTELNPTDYG